MLRMARHVHAADGHEESVPGRRRRAELRRQRPDSPRRAVRELWIQPAAGDAGGALGVALFIWHQLLTSREAPRVRDRQHGRCLGPRFSDEEIRHVSRRRRCRVSRASRPTTTLCRFVADLIGPTKRSSAGFRAGWNSARAPWVAQHHRRRPQRGDAVGDEPEDQVPRVLPAVRAVGAARNTSTNSSRCARRNRARTCCWSRRCSARSASHRTARNGTLTGLDKLKLARSTIPGGHARRLLGARADGRRRTRTAAITSCIQAFRGEDGLPGASSTPASTSAASRSSARPKTPIAASWPRTWTRWCSSDCVLLKDEQPATARPDVKQYLAQFELD